MAAAWLGNLLGGSGAAKEQQSESQSLLQDWNSYAGTRDIEAGTSAGTSSQSATDTLFQTVDKAGSSVSSFLQNSFTNVKQGVTSGVAAIPAALPTAETFSIPSGQQLTQFFGFVAGGGVLLLLAFMVFLPVIILSPSKFALSFTMGCLLIFIGFTQLRGWKQQLQHMMTKERLPFSAAYAGSILATLYAALFMHSYLLSLLCSGFQVVTLLYYLMSYFPGGTQGVKFMLNLMYQAFMSCFSGVQRLVLK